MSPTCVHQGPGIGLAWVLREIHLSLVSLSSKSLGCVLILLGTLWVVLGTEQEVEGQLHRVPRWITRIGVHGAHQTQSWPHLAFTPSVHTSQALSVHFHMQKVRPEEPKGSPSFWHPCLTIDLMSKTLAHLPSQRLLPEVVAVPGSLGYRKAERRSLVPGTAAPALQPKVVSSSAQRQPIWRQPV